MCKFDDAHLLHLVHERIARSLISHP
jgi:hypothetical protein